MGECAAVAARNCKAVVQAARCRLHTKSRNSFDSLLQALFNSGDSCGIEVIFLGVGGPMGKRSRRVAEDAEVKQKSSHAPGQLTTAQPGKKSQKGNAN
jgi:hypothetical protein